MLGAVAALVPLRLPRAVMDHSATIAWHEHVCAAECRDEIHGRFDAVEDETGKIFVLNMGTGAIRRCLTRDEALTVAKAAAEAWDRRRERRRRVAGKKRRP